MTTKKTSSKAPDPKSTPPTPKKKTSKTPAKTTLPPESKNIAIPKKLVDTYYSEKAIAAYTMSRGKALRVPARAFRFLRGIGLRTAIMSAMRQAGYLEEIHELGWNLLHGASGFRLKQKPSDYVKRYQDAESELDQWDEPNFQRTSIVLRNHFPDQHDYIFADGLKSAQGPEAILSIQTYLDRIDDLDNGELPEREAMREEDKAAVALLAERKILNPEIRQHLRKLIAITREIPPETNNDDDPSSEYSEAYRKNLIQLAMWLDEWATTAHSVIKRREHLLTLGLASRRKTTTKGDSATEDDGFIDSETDPTDQ
jgi:hypothetical protein